MADLQKRKGQSRVEDERTKRPCEGAALKGRNGGRALPRDG